MLYVRGGMGGALLGPGTCPRLSGSATEARCMASGRERGREGEREGGRERGREGGRKGQRGEKE